MPRGKILLLTFKNSCLKPLGFSESESTITRHNSEAVLGFLGNHDVEMPALDWGGHSKISHNTRLKSNRFILNHELSESCSFVN